MTSIKEKIETCLKEAFSPDHLEIIDESHLHRGHMGNPDGREETHFKILIVSDFFTPMATRNRHLHVNRALSSILLQVHAVSIHVYSPTDSPLPKSIP